MVNVSFPNAKDRVRPPQASRLRRVFAKGSKRNISPLSAPTTSFRAINDLWPVSLPFLTPEKRPVADRTCLLRQVPLFHRASALSGTMYSATEYSISFANATPCVGRLSPTCRRSSGSCSRTKSATKIRKMPLLTRTITARPETLLQNRDSRAACPAPCAPRFDRPGPFAGSCEACLHSGLRNPNIEN